MTKTHQTFENEYGEHTAAIKEVASLQEAIEESKNEQVKIIYVSRPLLSKEELKKFIPSQKTILQYLPIVLSGVVILYLLIFVLKLLTGDLDDSEGRKRILSAIHWFIYYPFVLATTTFTTLFFKRKGWMSILIWTTFWLAWGILILIHLKIIPHTEDILKGVYEFLNYL